MPDTDTDNNPELDYAQLLELLASMVDAQAGRVIPTGQAWQNDRQTLAKKLAYHLTTVQAIRAGSLLRIGDRVAPFVDHGSITVLARAALENFIVFAYVFGSPDMETCRFRHMTWQLGGLMDRQRRIAITDAGKLTMAVEKPQVAAQLSEVVQHDLFKAMTKGQQKAIVKRGDWATGRGWSELAVEAGLNERYFRNIYDYLCDYSHSSYAAALQVGQAQTMEVQAEMSRAMLGVMNLSMARFIDIYAGLFDSARELLERSPARLIAQKWNFHPDRFDEIYQSRT